MKWWELEYEQKKWSSIWPSGSHKTLKRKNSISIESPVDNKTRKKSQFFRDWAARGHREWKGAGRWRVKATEESLVVVGPSNGHHNWRKWTLNWLQCVFHRWPIRPWPFTCYLACQVHCCSQMVCRLDKGGRGWLDIALAQTQSEINDIFMPLFILQCTAWDGKVVQKSPLRRTNGLI